MLNPWRLQMEQIHTNFSVFILFTFHRKFNLVLTYSCLQMLFILGWPLCKYFLWLDPTYFSVSHKKTVTFWLSLLSHSTRKHPQLSEWNWLACQERAHTTIPVTSMSITIGKKPISLLSTCPINGIRDFQHTLTNTWWSSDAPERWYQCRPIILLRHLPGSPFLLLSLACFEREHNHSKDHFKLETGHLYCIQNGEA